MSISSILGNYSGQLRSNIYGQGAFALQNLVNTTIGALGIPGLGTLAGLVPGSDTETGGFKDEPMLAFTYRVTLPNGCTLPSDYVSDINIDLFSLATVATRQQTKNTNYIGFRDLKYFSITFNEDKHGSILNYITTWMSKMVDSNGNYFPASYYKFSDLSLQVIDRDLQPIVIFNPIRCFPTSISGYDFGIAKSVMINPIVTFSMDDVNLTILNPTSDTILTPNGVAASSIFPNFNVPGLGNFNIPVPSFPRPSDILSGQGINIGGLL